MFAITLFIDDDDDDDRLDSPFLIFFSQTVSV